MLKVIQRKVVWFVISGILVVLSIASPFLFGLNLGIDFTGGSLMELSFANERPDKSVLEDELTTFDLEASSIQPSNDASYVVRLEQLSEERHQEVLTGLKESFEGLEEQRFESIGPTIGRELREKSFIAIVLVLLAIVFYIAYAFRKVSRPVQSWKYGIVAIVTLFHDILIVGGIYILMGKIFGYQIDTLFVTALLTTLGYSVNDTIVTFDRIRDNLTKNSDLSFAEIVNKSVNETIIRSLNTGATTFLVLFAIFLFGGSSIQPFVFALMTGVVIGTYSSIFLASPLLVAWQRISSK